MIKKAELKEYYKHKYMLSEREILVKTIVLRIISSLITAALVLAITSSWAFCAQIFWIDFIVKLILYYFFEKGWFKFRKKWAEPGDKK